MAYPLLVADAPALLYRAFFALPDSIKGADDRPVNALLGSLNALLQVVEEREPRAVVVCFGQESAAYRVEAYPPYHAARPPAPDALAAQFAAAPALYEAFGWTVLDHPDLEADDLLGSLAAIEEAAGGGALILTGDRALFQSASDGGLCKLPSKSTAQRGSRCRMHPKGASDGEISVAVQRKTALTSEREGKAKAVCVAETLAGMFER